MSQGRANEWIHRLSPLLQRALAHEGGADLVIDGTERRRQRPQVDTAQRSHYSGKKKTHTDKNIVVSNAHSQTVVDLSPTVGGSVHDKKAADEAALPIH